jgi:phosphoglycerol transferase
MSMQQAIRDMFALSIRAASRIPTWVDAITVAMLCIAVVLSLPGNWHSNLHAPFLDFGDATSAQYLIKTVLDHGWYASNPDVGAPFGATMYDYPIPEPTHFLLIRLLGLFGNDPFLVFNLFYLFSFASAALAAWWALRYLAISRPMAIAGAFLFSMLPYHFLRIGHLYLASYFAAAIFAAHALRLALYRAPHLSAELRLTLASSLLLAIAAGSGIYYAFFGCLFVASGAVLGAVQSRQWEPLRIGAAYIAIIVAVVVLSMAPNVLYHLAEGANPAVAQRLPQEAEIYGLRITQLLLPAQGHRVAWLAAITAAYNAHAPQINENHTATLGVLGSIGLVAAMLISLFGNRARFPQLAAAGALSIAGILFATIGGFGALFALLITPDLRGLNRISVFIGFFAILSTLLLAHRLVGPRPLLAAALALGMMVVGWVDEVPGRPVARMNPAAFQQQQIFFDRLQASLAPGTAVYQLPYMFFPENPKLKALSSYALFEPYLRTRGLRWSFGEMRGRAADVWNEQVSHLGGADLVGALASAGFGAIYLDRRGYDDHGAAIDRSLAALLGAPLLEDPAQNIAIYRILPTSVSKRPFVAVGPGREWYPWEENVGHLIGWTKGSADLLVVNPNIALPFVVQFNASSPLPRHLSISYGGTPLYDDEVRPGVAAEIKLSFTAQPGLSRIQLDTDKPAGRAGNNDPRQLAFRIADLYYAAAIQ